MALLSKGCFVCDIDVMIMCCKISLDLPLIVSVNLYVKRFTKYILKYQLPKISDNIPVGIEVVSHPEHRPIQRVARQLLRMQWEVNYRYLPIYSTITMIPTTLRYLPLFPVSKRNRV